MIVSAFYDSRKKKVETIISDTRDGTPANKNGVKAYIDKYCPPEFRMIDGVDSLSINVINAKIEFINGPIIFFLLSHFSMNTFCRCVGPLTHWVSFWLRYPL